MTDEELEMLIGNVLRVGVLVSLIVVATGGALYLVQNFAESEPYSRFSGVTSDLQTLSGIWTSAKHMGSEGLIQLGLVLLIATPVVRVVMAGVGFLITGDRMYFVVSLIVLTILAYSIAHAL